MQNFIVATNASNLKYLAQDYFTPGPTTAPDEVRGDSEVAFSIQPVLATYGTAAYPYSHDFLDDDVLTMGIGNFDEAPTGGVFSLQVGATTSGLADLSGTITAAALTTALNAALTTEAKPLCLVTELQDGVYNVVAVSNGAITDGFFAVVAYSALYPVSTATWNKGTNGSASTKYNYTLVLVQSALCYAEATDLIGDADAVIELVQAGSATANKIQRIRFSNGAFSGTATLAATADAVTATCGVITPTMSANEIGTVLRIHENIAYNETDGTTNNIVVTFINIGVWTVEFIGDLGGTDSNTLTIPDYDVSGQKGKSGTINYNTYELLLYSYSQSGDYFHLTRQIKRSRADGELRTLYSQRVTIWKNILNAATATPVPLPSYLTSTESDARYLRTGADSNLISGFQLIIDNGATLAIVAGSTVNLFGTPVTLKTGTGSFVLGTSPGFTTAANPATSDGATLGTTGLQWGDLFLSEGGVINWDAGDVTLTQAGNTLTLAGGELILPAVGPTSTLSAGYRGFPQTSFSSDYPIVLTDAGNQLMHPTADNNPRTATIPANGSIAFPIGTQLLFINEINTLTIAITTDTLVLAGAGTTGSRTLAAMGMALAVKKTSTSWIITDLGGLT